MAFANTISYGCFRGMDQCHLANEARLGRHETSVPARSDALKVRFHGIRAPGSPLVINLS